VKTAGVLLVGVGLACVAGFTFAAPAAAAPPVAGEPSVFLCWAWNEPPAVFPLSAAAALPTQPYDPVGVVIPQMGYWQPLAVADVSEDQGSDATRLGAFYLVCAIPYAVDTGSAIGGGETAAAYRGAGTEALGIYELYTYGGGPIWGPIPSIIGRRPFKPVHETLLQLTGCELRGALPDPACTPGARVGDRAAVCATGTAPGSPGAAAKLRVYADYGLVAHKGALTVDRLVGPALGGTDDLANLWPVTASARKLLPFKAKLERRLHTLVCSGSLTLAAAQQKLSSNWLELYKTVFGALPPA
jgi:hypothetical protein